MRDAAWARLFLDELCNFPKSEFTDQVDSTSQFINWMRESDSPLMSLIKAENERVRLDNIRLGLPVRYLIPGMPGSAVFVCAYPGCGKELIPNESVIYETRGQKFCSPKHAM